MSERIKVQSVVIGPSFTINHDAIEEAIEWCIAPLSDLSEQRQAHLRKRLRVAVDWYLCPKMLEERYGGRRQVLSILERLKKHALALQEDLRALHPEYAIAFSVALEEGAPNLMALPAELERLVNFAKRGIDMGPASEGGQSNELLRRAVRVLMTGLHDVTGEWPRAYKNRSGIADPHLVGKTGEVIRRFFERFDSHVTVGSLVYIIKKERPSLIARSAD